MKIKQIFDEIAAESSTKKKMEILEKYKGIKLLEKVLYLANSKRIKFYIKQIPEYVKYSERTVFTNSIESLSSAIQFLEALSQRVWTGNDAINELRGWLSGIPEDDAYIVERIIEKDCKIGMGTTNINKIFPNLIEKTPYMGAISFDEKKVRTMLVENEARKVHLGLGSVTRNMAYNGYSQVKMDGRYCNAIIRFGEVELESRQGEPTILTGAKFIDELATLNNCVLNGELTMGPTISRYESNGIIASLIDIQGKQRDEKEHAKKVAAFEKKHKLTVQEALDKIVYTIWDRITIDEYFACHSYTPYYIRLDIVVEMITLPYGLPHGQQYTNIGFVETKMLNTYEEAIEHFQEVLNRGEEGTILKSYYGEWKNSKPNWQIKMKLEMDVDLKIVGFNYGTGKNKDIISSLNAESEDGKVFTKPTGINEETMNYITQNQEALLGTIIEVKCSGLSKNVNNKYALLHPVFKTLRDDKDTADTFETIVAIENMAKGLS